MGASSRAITRRTFVRDTAITTVGCTAAFGLTTSAVKPNRGLIQTPLEKISDHPKLFDAQINLSIDTPPKTRLLILVWRWLK